MESSCYSRVVFFSPFRRRVEVEQVDESWALQLINECMQEDEPIRVAPTPPETHTRSAAALTPPPPSAIERQLMAKLPQREPDDRLVDAAEVLESKSSLLTNLLGRLKRAEQR